ncbi:MAG: hypothetical protein PQJ58_20220 [Spirochaetales bacterium]|nr:hypothetical protein [Spirochaetales bacterium]
MITASLTRFSRLSILLLSTLNMEPLESLLFALGGSALLIFLISLFMAASLFSGFCSSTAAFAGGAAAFTVSGAFGSSGILTLGSSLTTPADFTFDFS